ALTVSGTTGRYQTAGERALLTRTLMTRLAAVDGIRSVGLALTPPTFWAWSMANLEIEGEPLWPVGTINRNRIGSSYLRTMDIRLVQGTTFTDTTAAGHQVIVNANFARKQWPDGSAIGRRLRIRTTGAEPWLTIIGVVGDALTSGAQVGSTKPVLYTPAADSSDGAIVLSTAGSAAPLAPVQALIRSIDPG